MRSRPGIAVLLLAAAAAALFWLRPWESVDPSPEPLAPGERTPPAPATLEGRRAAAPSEAPPAEKKPATTKAPTDLRPRTVPEVPRSTTTLRGRVVDADGRAVAGADVIAYRLPTPDEAHSNRTATHLGPGMVFWVPVNARGKTGDDGRFELAVPDTGLLVQVYAPLGIGWTGEVASPADPLEVALER